MTTVKHLILLPSVILFLWGCNQEETGTIQPGSVEVTGKPDIVFDREIHDFGEISQGEMVSCIFTYKNTGSSDLILEAANASCGCTIPQFSQAPLAPGESERIEVLFDSTGRSGMQSKTVTIISNADSKMVRLTITANIFVKNQS